MPSIKLPDGSVRQAPEGSTVLQVAESIGKRLAQAAVVGKLDGKLVDLSARIPEGEHSLQIMDRSRSGGVADFAALDSARDGRGDWEIVAGGAIGVWAAAGEWILL